MPPCAQLPPPPAHPLPPASTPCARATDREATRLWKAVRKAFAEYVDTHRTWVEFFGGFSLPAGGWPATEERIMFNYHRFSGNYCTVGLALAAWTLLRSPRLLLALVFLAVLWLYSVRGSKPSNLPGSLRSGSSSGGGSEDYKRYALLGAGLLAVYFSGVVTSLAVAGLWTALVVGLHAAARTSPRQQRDVRHPSSSSAAGAMRGGGGGRGGESGAESDGGAGGYGAGGGAGGWQPAGPGQPWGSSGAGEDTSGLRARGMAAAPQQQQQAFNGGQHQYQQHYSGAHMQQQQPYQQQGGQGQHFAPQQGALPRPKQRD